MSEAPPRAGGDRIDLRSDFLAHRTPAMAQAWARAEREPFAFGLREDAHQRALERRIAELTAHEDALVFPTCTMANLVAVMLAAPRGSRVLTHEGAHVITSEAGGGAAIAGVQLVPLPGELAAQRPEQWAEAASEHDAQRPATTLFVLENTHNRAAGLPLPGAYTRAVTAVARERGIRTHLDGSRLFQAAAALGSSPAALSEGFDTVSISLNKGFGAPVAAALAGSRESIAKALVLRQRLGGGIRPTGPAAAATLAALSEVDHFAEAQRLAGRLAEGLATIARIHIDPASVRTNIVAVDLESDLPAATAQAHLAEHGLLVLPFGEHRLRMVTYRGIGEADVERAVAIARGVFQPR